LSIVKSGKLVETVCFFAMMIIYSYYLWRANAKGILPIKMRTFAAVEAVKEGCDRAAEEGKLVVVGSAWGASTRGRAAMAVAYLTFMGYTAREAARRGVEVRAPIGAGYEESIALVQNTVREAYMREGHPEMVSPEMTEYAPNNILVTIGYFKNPPGTSLLVYVGALGGGTSPSITGAARQHGAMTVGGATRWPGMFQVILMNDYALITDECYAATDMISQDPKGLSVEATTEIIKMAFIVIGVIGILMGIAGAGDTIISWLAA
jgi:hypothetical protein